MVQAEANLFVTFVAGDVNPIMLWKTTSGFTLVRSLTPVSNLVVRSNTDQLKNYNGVTYLPM